LKTAISILRQIFKSVINQSGVFPPITIYIGKSPQSALKIAGWVSSTVVGHNLPPLVDIGLINLAKPGWAVAHPAHPSPTPL